MLSNNRYRKVCVLKPDFVLGVGGGRLPQKNSKFLWTRYCYIESSVWANKIRFLSLVRFECKTNIRLGNRAERTSVRNTTVSAAIFWRGNTRHGREWYHGQKKRLFNSTSELWIGTKRWCDSDFMLWLSSKSQQKLLLQRTQSYSTIMISPNLSKQR